MDSKNLTIIGMDTDECIVDGSGIPGLHSVYCMWWFNDSDIKLENLTFKYQRRDDTHFFTGIFYAQGFARVNHCIFDSTDYCLALTCSSEVSNVFFKNTINAVGVNGYYYPGIKIENCVMDILSNVDLSMAVENGAGGGSFKINNNILIQRPGVPPFYYPFYGLKLFTNERIEVRNNLFCGFQNAMQLACYSGGDKDTVFIENNTITNCKAYGISSGNFVQSRVIRNNIVNACPYAIYSYNDVSMKADYNLYNKIRKSIYYFVIPGEHEIVADPMFVNDTLALLNGNYDYRLQKYSPAINSGDPSILDVDGSRSDMGMFGGPCGMRTDYLDLPPKQIKTITADYIQDSSKINIVWEKRWEADFKEYRLYKDVNPNFTINTNNLIATVTDSIYIDYLTKGSQELYYKVTAVDNTGNESIPSVEVNVTITDVNDTDIKLNYNYQLYQNYPNPFNPTTTISYCLKEPGDVRVKLYNITGQLLQTIIEGEKSKGYNETKIDLSNYASGIYLYRLEVTGKGKIPVFNDLKKMVYVK